MEMQKKNWLANLGWLGLVGVWGFVFQTPMLMVYLIFFYFFTYRGIPLDEMLRTNVYKAAARGFAVYVATNTLSNLAGNIRAIWIYRLKELPTITAEFVTMRPEAYAQWQSYFTDKWWCFFLSVATFILTLVYFNRKEKKLAED